jgi:hypothetical protein
LSLLIRQQNDFINHANSVTVRILRADWTIEGAVPKVAFRAHPPLAIQPTLFPQKTQLDRVIGDETELSPTSPGASLDVLAERQAIYNI